METRKSASDDIMTAGAEALNFMQNHTPSIPPIHTIKKKSPSIRKYPSYFHSRPPLLKDYTSCDVPRLLLHLFNCHSNQQLVSADEMLDLPQREELKKFLYVMNITIGKSDQTLVDAITALKTDTLTTLQGAKIADFLQNTVLIDESYAFFLDTTTEQYQLADIFYNDLVKSIFSFYQNTEPHPKHTIKKDVNNPHEALAQYISDAHDYQLSRLEGSLKKQGRKPNLFNPKYDGAHELEGSGPGPTQITSTP